MFMFILPMTMIIMIDVTMKWTDKLEEIRKTHSYTNDTIIDDKNIEMQDGMNDEDIFQNTEDLKPGPIGRAPASVSGESKHLHTLGDDHYEAVLFEISSF